MTSVLPLRSEPSRPLLGDAPAPAVKAGLGIAATARPGRFDAAKRLMRGALPLAARKRLARFLGRQRWLSAGSWWAHELLRDFAATDPNGYHRFLWANHLGYAETYEVAVRFGADRLHPTRRLLFEELQACLTDLAIRPDAVDSVFEVGCSLGYNLRFLETDVFSAATVFDGCDIDGYAVAQGSAYLHAYGSRVRLFRADMGDLDAALGDCRYDVTLSAGVLMYLQRPEAHHVVASLLRHTKHLAVFAGLADPDDDNATLQTSRVRSSDGTFIHDIDAMVRRAGGRVVRRRWEGARLVEGNTVYFVFATPSGARP